MRARCKELEMSESGYKQQHQNHAEILSLGILVRTSLVKSTLWDF